jgi:RimJ/RimL family protein N-acetyltransferase
MNARPVPVLRGERVTLRPYRPDEWRAVVDLLLSFDDWLEKPARDQLNRRVRRSGLLWRGKVDLAIEADGRLVGQIQTYHHTGMDPDSVGLGIMLFDKADRGRGFGTEAVTLLTNWVLDSGTAARMEAGTMPRNRAMRTVFERAGWRHIGSERAFGRTWAAYERTAQT